MELTYDLTQDDFVALDHHDAECFADVARSWRIRGPMYLAGIAAFAYYYSVTHKQMPFPETLSTFATGLGVVVAFFLLKMAFQKRLIDRTVRAAYADIGTLHCALGITEERVVFDTQISSMRWFWAAVTAIEESEHHVFVRCTTYSKVIIPKRAFDSAQHMQAFLDETRRLKAEGQAATQASEAGEPAAR